MEYRRTGKHVCRGTWTTKYAAAGGAGGGSQVRRKPPRDLSTARAALADTGERATVATVTVVPMPSNGPSGSFPETTWYVIGKLTASGRPAGKDVAFKTIAVTLRAGPPPRRSVNGPTSTARLAKTRK